jgi:lysophospholipase
MWHWNVRDPKAVIVLVHGAGEHHGRYEWVINQLNEHGYYVIAGDLPGQGNNYKKQGHINSFTEYIETIESWVKQALQIGVPVFLFGHSMGGLATIRTMTERKLPVKAVILSSPCVKLMSPPPLPLNIASKALNVVTPTLRVPSGIRKGTGTRNSEILERDENDQLRVKKVSIRWYRQLVKAMNLVEKKISKFPNVPLLVMQAGDDLIVNQKSVEKWFNRLSLSDKTYKEWPGLYHEVLNEPEREKVLHYLIKYIEIHL